MRILVCGDWTDEHKNRLYACLDRLHRQHLFDVVIEGDKPGTDRMAGFWARKNRLDNLKFPPAKKLHRAAAVPLQNEEMLVKGRPAWVIAFLLNDLPDMVIRARQRSIPVSEVRLVKSWYSIVNAQEEMAHGDNDREPEGVPSQVVREQRGTREGKGVSAPNGPSRVAQRQEDDPSMFPVFGDPSGDS